MAKNYAEVIETQLAITELHMMDATRSETDYLQTSREELKQKCKVMQHAKSNKMSDK